MLVRPSQFYSRTAMLTDFGVVFGGDAIMKLQVVFLVDDDQNMLIKSEI